MTVVLLHGVPETVAVWDQLVPMLDRTDVERLALPGFGSPEPDFDPTKENYAEWVVGELARFDQVDLVAHDWGGLLALRILADRPANVRSWAMDMGDLGADFHWHDLALLWISPDGEAMMEGFVDGPVADRAALLTAGGVPEAGAQVMAEAFDATMARCILALYRSAADVGNDWGPGIDSIVGPGLVLDAANDPYKSSDRSRLLAERVGAELAPLPEAGHWWMLDAPQVAAAVLNRFWSSLN